MEQGIHYLQAQIRITLTEGLRLILRIVHSEVIQVTDRVTLLRAVVPTDRVTLLRAVVPADRVTPHHAVVPAADRGVTRHQGLRLLLEAPAQDPPVEVAVALQAKGNSR